MARLLGMITRSPVDISLSIGHPQHVTFATHGWGIAWYDQARKLHMQKGKRSAVTPRMNQSVQLQITTHLFIFHMRQATSGDVSERNTHPFSYKNVSFAHNGSVNKEKLSALLHPPFNTNFQSEPIDSELYFRALLQGIASTDPVEAVRQVTQMVNNPRGANFLMADGEALYGYRYGLPLYWTRWREERHFLAQTPVGLQLSSTQLSSQIAYIISSDKIIPANWTAFDDGELFVIRKNLQYDTYKF
ncbi:class II glutamine amidotransferase [Candidatus Roizmanbacteria bacterium]|nr:class II glutamine amidotransferase [Candidatus Roizmanbacteria bacterium]